MHYGFLLFEKGPSLLLRLGVLSTLRCFSGFSPSGFSLCGARADGGQIATPGFLSVLVHYLRLPMTFLYTSAVKR